MTPIKINKNHLLGWGMTSVLVLLILLALVNSPTVARAMKSVFDSTPGVGKAEQDASLRALVKPITRERDGIKLTVRQVVLNSEETVLTYTANNTFDDGPPCRRNVSLRLPSGASLSPVSGGGSGSADSGLTFTATFTAIPAGVDQARLIIPCMLKSGEDWEIPLRFTPTSTDATDESKF